MRREFIDFFNHGALPSVGRESERERIVDFWRLSPGEGGTELRAALLIGEAGVGKSHLIDGAIRAIEAQGGASVHIKLRPEGTASLAPLIDEGLRRSETARRIGGDEDVATMQKAIARLRRLCSLRRTILVIEDAHLIAPENVREFAFLIDALRDEPLPLLIAARPQELAIRAIIEGAIREEIVVEGLGRDDLRDLWLLVFGERPTADTLRTLLDATHGNPLAIRSTLRGSIRSGSLEASTEENRSHVTVDIGAFAEIARRSSAGVIVGMTIDLDPAEREAAERFALLGEVFAAEAAAMMVDDADRAIESLLFRGLLATSLTPTSPLDTSRSARLPLAFTHTLLHDALITDAELHADRLITALASGVPLYTRRPLRLLGEMAISSELATDTIIAAIERLKEISRLLDHSSEWRHASEVLDVADHLTDQLVDRVDHRAVQTIRAELLSRRLFLMRRSKQSVEYGALAERLYHLSDEAEPDSIAALRLAGITHRLRHLHDSEQRNDDALMSEAHDLIASHPELRTSHERLQYVGSFGPFGVNTPGTADAMLTLVQREMNDMLSFPSLPEKERHLILTTLGRFLIYRHDTPEQMSDARRLIDELDPLIADDDVQYLYLRASFLLMDGEFAILIAQAPAIYRAIVAQGHFGTYLRLREREILARLIVGQPVDDVVAAFRALEGEVAHQPEANTEVAEVRNRYIHSLLFGLVLIDRVDLLDHVVEQIELSEEERRLVETTISPIHVDDPDGARRAIADGSADASELERIILSDEPWLAEAEELALSRLRRKPFRLLDAGNDFTALRLIDFGLTSGRIPHERPILDAMRKAVRDQFDWFAERRIGTSAGVLLKRYGGYLATADRKERAMILQRMTTSDDYPFAWDRPGRLRIAAIGEFAVEGSDRAMHPLRGGRNRMALGTLVAQALQRRPLDRQSFLAQATGITDDPERARTTWNVIALRLRDALGRDIVRIDDGVPTLDIDQADVDLIAARDLLDTFDRERRAGHLLAAREALQTVIRIVAGTLLFPGLYDELFETLRDDWESRLRDAVLKLAGELTEAGDEEGCGELLEVYERGWE